MARPLVTREILAQSGPETEQGRPTSANWRRAPLTPHGSPPGGRRSHPSGTGKSTALAELARRGHRVVDTDHPGWLTDVPRPDGPEPMWDLERMRALLDGHRAGWLFVSGCVANQGAVYDRFDAVVLLSAPVEVISARVVGRPNPFGSRPEDRAKIASDLATFEPLLRARADDEMVTTEPVAEVVTALERVATGVDRQGRGPDR